MVRACISQASMVEMGKIGRPVLIGIQTVDTLRDRLRVYQDTMRRSGFSETEMENAMDQTWGQRGLYVADSDDEAVEVASTALVRYRAHLLDARVRFNPGGAPPRDPDTPTPAAELVEHAFLAGTPETVVRGIEELKTTGVRNLLLNPNVGQIPREQVEKSMRLFGDKVLPLVK